MNQSPVMAERMRQTKNRILQTAKDIFLEQGCRRTTIRQIVERSGITSGSIYNIFSSKEEIFNTLAADVLENCIRMVHKEAGGESPLYQYAAVLLVEMEAIARDERVRELYQEAYTSPAMFEAAVNRHVRLEMKIFGESYGKLFKEDEILARNYMVKGAMGGFINSFYFKDQPPVEEAEFLLLSLTFRVLGSKKKDILPMLKSLDQKREVWAMMAKDILKK